MQKIIDVTDLQRNFRRVLDEVSERHTPYVLTRGSRPEAALVPYEHFVRYQELEEREVLDVVERCMDRFTRRSAERSEEEVTRDVGRALGEVRRGNG